MTNHAQNQEFGGQKPIVHGRLQDINELDRSCHNAVMKAQEESRRLGVPNVYSIDGVIHYELPNGESTTEVPEIYRDKSEPTKS